MVEREQTIQLLSCGQSVTKSGEADGSDKSQLFVVGPRPSKAVDVRKLTMSGLINSFGDGSGGMKR